MSSFIEAETNRLFKSDHFTLYCTRSSSRTQMYNGNIPV